jgi:hypothetical protein
VVGGPLPQLLLVVRAEVVEHDDEVLAEAGPQRVVGEADALRVEDAPQLAAADGGHHAPVEQVRAQLVRLQEVNGSPRSTGRARATFTISAR